jgi:hypothetical protein
MRWRNWCRFRPGCSSCSGGVGGRVSRLWADSAEHRDFLEHPGITGGTPEPVASPPYRSTQGVMHLWMALRGEIPAPAMIISPGECATRPHMAGWVPHPPGDIIPGIPTPIRISPPTLADQLRVVGVGERAWVRGRDVHPRRGDRDRRVLVGEAGQSSTVLRIAFGRTEGAMASWLVTLMDKILAPGATPANVMPGVGAAAMMLATAAPCRRSPLPRERLDQSFRQEIILFYLKSSL